MPNYDVNDIVEVKKRQKRRKKLIKFLIFMIIVIVAGCLYYSRDSWLPKLEGLGEKYQQTIKNDGTLAEGNFPIEVSGGSAYQMDFTDDTIYLLNDAYVYIYNEDGSLIESRQHAYSNAVMQTANGMSLIYESGGYNFKVESNSKTVFSDKMENNIIFGRISSQGYIAIVTTSDKFASILTVYDENGKFVYSRDCIEKIIDVSFTDDSSGCLLSFITVSNGTLINVTQQISFTDQEPIWISEADEIFCMESYPTDSGGAVIIGEDECTYYDNTGQSVNTILYDGTFAGGDVKGNKTAIITNDEQRRKYTLTLINSAKAEPVIINSENVLKSVLIYDECAYIMTSENIMAYDFQGQLRSTVEISDAYNSFRRSDDYIFLLGYDKIDRIDYDN